MEKWRGLVFAMVDQSSPIFFFADDSLIFYKASIIECDALQGVLEAYEKALG